MSKRGIGVSKWVADASSGDYLFPILEPPLSLTSTCFSSFLHLYSHVLISSTFAHASFRQPFIRPFAWMAFGFLVTGLTCMKTLSTSLEPNYKIDDLDHHFPWVSLQYDPGSAELFRLSFPSQQQPAVCAAVATSVGVCNLWH